MPCRLRDLPDRLARLGLDLGPVEREADWIGHCDNLSDPAKPLDEVVDLRLRPGIAIVPEIEQIVLVPLHPLDNLRRHLANGAKAGCWR